MFNANVLDAFWLFITERQNVFYRRKILGLPRPWTGDEVIANARFTNVYRELDRGTQFTVEEIMEKSDDKYLSQIITEVITYRFFNRIDTYTDIAQLLLYHDKFVVDNNLHDTDMYTDITNGIAAVLKMRRDSKQKIYTGAYMASYCPKMGGRDREHDAALVVQEIARKAPIIAGTMMSPRGTVRGIYDIISTIKGFGKFLSYQCALDFTYPLSTLGGSRIAQYADQSKWSKAGPGAEEGLRILGMEETGDKHRLEAMRELYLRQFQDISRLGLSMQWLRDKDGNTYSLSLSNIENCLCEFQKWWRMHNGGHVKTIWSPPQETDWQPSSVTLPFYGEWNDRVFGRMIVL